MRLLHLTTAAAALASPALGSIVILPGGAPKPFQSRRAPATNAQAFFNGSAINEFTGTSAKVLMSSFDPATSTSTYPSGDSFVRGAIQAWGEHLHLVIRPEEVWFTILAQLNFYMNANAESVRSLFVSHAGQETIKIEDFTWHAVLSRFSGEIQARVKTPWLLSFVHPNFTTTTDSDRMTANILMMGLTKAFFKFEGGIICGLPSVTLLGTEADWAALLARLDRLPEFGPDPAAYAARLRPILTRFVRSFAAPDAPETKAFWNNIVIAQEGRICGSPPVSISGWITGFFYWRDDGAPYARQAGGDLVLDGVAYPLLDMTKLPVGYARAPFTMLDYNGTARFEAYVAAGTMGKEIKEGWPEGYEAAVKRGGGKAVLGARSGHATLRPLSSWVLYGPVPHAKERGGWVGEEDLNDGVTSLRGGLQRGECLVGSGPGGSSRVS
ncbi:hypothetical protein QBC39DRAFT_404424 [Podospora conica]|nr:hypothetical protein QBC39DRAFT_404424 [Schizothecium conicum]